MFLLVLYSWSWTHLKKSKIFPEGRKCNMCWGKKWKTMPRNSTGSTSLFLLCVFSSTAQGKSPLLSIYLLLLLWMYVFFFIILTDACTPWVFKPCPFRYLNVWTNDVLTVTCRAMFNVVFVVMQIVTSWLAMTLKPKIGLYYQKTIREALCQYAYYTKYCNGKYGLRRLFA